MQEEIIPNSNSGLKWAYSRDGNIRFLVPLDHPDIIEGFKYDKEIAKKLGNSCNPK
jgi:hypothetical protein